MRKRSKRSNTYFSFQAASLADILELGRVYRFLDPKMCRNGFYKNLKTAVPDERL